MFHIAPHPGLHAAFEALAYALALVVYWRIARSAGDVLSNRQRWNVIAGAMVGALAGSRLLGLLEQIPFTRLSFSQIFLPGGGKTVVGGLLGGWLAVEITKKLGGIQSRTGDIFVIPLCMGIGVGRVGCLLAGPADHTYGNATSLFWGVDFGDGVARHPTQAYEIVFLTILALVLHHRAKFPHRNGVLFDSFIGAYLSWRLLIDFLKPEPLISGLNVTQWACVTGLVLLTITLFGFPWKLNRSPTGKYA